MVSTLRYLSSVHSTSDVFYSDGRVLPSVEMDVNKFALLCFACQLFCLVLSQHRFDCYDGFCSKDPCPQLDCENGILMENATKCGCCHICVKLLGENETCSTEYYGVIPGKMCGPRLICEKNKCVPVKTRCMEDLGAYEALPFGKAKPECDDKGFFNSTVCISDVLCYCVDRNGKRIFGTDVASRKNSMHCNCSRDFEEFSTKVQFKKEDFLRCLPNGNYDTLQCTESSCYCMQDFEGEIDVEDHSNINNLLCFDKERHKNVDEFLRSKCWQERLILLEQIEGYENQSVTVIGVDLPQCDLDGSYAPVQCSKKSCYCVNKNGQVIKNTEVERNSEDSRNMTCRCAREKEMLKFEKNKNKNMNNFEKFECTRNGNYKTTQNIGASTITVDSEMGFQIHVESEEDF